VETAAFLPFYKSYLDYFLAAVSFLVVSFLEVSAIFIFDESAILAESAAFAESAALVESAEEAPDFDLQAAKEKAIAKANTPTLNEFFIVNFFKVI